MQNFFKEIETSIKNKGLLYPLDVLFVGATGSGKSSTLNSIFGFDVAKVGDGVDPETKDIKGYSLNKYFRLHDSAGLGDGKKSDENHGKNISNKLLETIVVSNTEYGFIDLCLVILDGGTRDIGTATKLLESVILKCIQPERVCILINQADMAMKGRNWNSITNKPNSILYDFLEEQSNSIEKRLCNHSGSKFPKPVYYSAAKKYNLDKVMTSIIKSIPNSRRTFNKNIKLN